MLLGTQVEKLGNGWACGSLSLPKQDVRALLTHTESSFKEKR